MRPWLYVEIGLRLRLRAEQVCIRKRHAARCGASNEVRVKHWTMMLGDVEAPNNCSHEFDYLQPPGTHLHHGPKK